MYISNNQNYSIYSGLLSSVSNGAVLTGAILGGGIGYCLFANYTKDPNSYDPNKGGKQKFFTKEAISSAKKEFKIGYSCGIGDGFQLGVGTTLGFIGGAAITAHFLSRFTKTS